MCLVSACVIAAMGMIIKQGVGGGMAATAGLLCSHSKWISMGKQTSDVVTENSEAGGPSEVQHIRDLWML